MARARVTRASKGSSADAARRPGLRQRKVAEVVALEIVRDMVERNLGQGDALPLEAEMLVQYRVSRASLREALRLLETQGLIAIRPGPGGTVVGGVSPEHLGRTLTLYYHMAGTRYDELLEAWLASEPLLAELAARNPDAKLRARLLSPFLEETAARDCHVGISTGLGFHDAIAELADNRALSLICQSVSVIVSDQVIANTSRAELEPYIVEEHESLAHAVIDGDPALSRELMHAHIEHLIANFKTVWPDRVGERVTWR